jgi:hypothetical protein
MGLIAGAAIAVALAFGGYKASSGVEAAARAQALSLENLRVWKAAYQALEPVNAQWKEIFGISADAASQDLVAIGQALKLADSGLSYDINSLRSDKIEPVVFDGSSIGLNRICVSGGASAGLGVSAPTMGGLIKGISELSRKDIEIGSISVSYVEGVPRASLGGLCVLVRSEIGNG